MSQANLWEVCVRRENNDDERPKDGWKILEHTPEGLRAITTRRGRAVKFKQIGDAFGWIEKNKKGYVVNMDCYNYTGVLNKK